MIAQTFWLVLVIACVVWYSTITVYVAVKGAMDISGMLARLKAQQGDPDA
ncbi:MAG: hypothetical protein NTW87_24540 [Planctomycetota bacterium]|nr:hypothetical protein [Planctomycetota bacterium]